jgi:GH43 family beta-xylosidase
MRKPRDFDAELQALTDKAKALKSKKQGQLGELVIATGADALSIEQLAGALLDAVGADAARKEAWRKSGAAFFRTGGARARSGAGRNAGGAAASGAGAQPPSGEAGAA